MKEVRAGPKKTTHHVRLHADALDSIHVQSRYWTLSEERAQRDYEFVGYYVRTPPNLRTVSFEQGIVELRHPIKCKQLNVKFDCTLICHCEVAVEECTKVVVLTKANVYTWRGETGLVRQFKYVFDYSDFTDRTPGIWNRMVLWNEYPSGARFERVDGQINPVDHAYYLPVFRTQFQTDCRPLFSNNTISNLSIRFKMGGPSWLHQSAFTDQTLGTTDCVMRWYELYFYGPTGYTLAASFRIGDWNVDFPNEGPTYLTQRQNDVLKFGTTPSYYMDDTTSPYTFGTSGQTLDPLIEGSNIPAGKSTLSTSLVLSNEWWREKDSGLQLETLSTTEQDYLQANRPQWYLCGVVYPIEGKSSQGVYRDWLKQGIDVHIQLEYDGYEPSTVQ
mmetsp:Transcript_30880/g.81044  ORF Transcript_30880/g.81044 Transcript_30880/m.81044 type:complete len:388 (-) Transcript_30880:351-1514(-)